MLARLHPLLPTSTPPDTHSILRQVYVDGGLIEAFLGGMAITPLVSPDPNAARPEQRTTSVVETSGGLDCSVQSWQLAYSRTDDSPTGDH